MSKESYYASVLLGPGMTDMGTGDTNTQTLQEESSTGENFRTTAWFLSTLAFVGSHILHSRSLQCGK